MNHSFYPGSKTDLPIPGGVSRWFKQDEIHQSTHVHGVPAFLPWHREIVNRFEDLIRSHDPELSLHYWNWTEDPMPFFTDDFMGSAHGLAGQKWQDAGFYDPHTREHRDVTLNPADPPSEITRNIGASGPLVDPSEDQDALDAPDFPTFHRRISKLHARMHNYIGGPPDDPGTLTDPHRSFRDPFVFLLHSNMDRLWAMWQRDPAHTERLDPAKAYGIWGTTVGSGDVETERPFWGILSPLEPWAGHDAQNASTGFVANVVSTRPWAPPDSQTAGLPPGDQISVRNSLDDKVVVPRAYDTVPV